MAPEVTKMQTRYDGKADVFSMGVIMFSLIMTRDRPNVQGYVYTEQDLTASPHSQELKMLTLSCLETEPTNRPNINQLLAALKVLHRQTQPQSNLMSFDLDESERMHDEAIKTLSTQDSCFEADEWLENSIPIPLEQKPKQEPFKGTDKTDDLDHA